MYRFRNNIISHQALIGRVFNPLNVFTELCLVFIYSLKHILQKWYHIK